MYIYIYIYIHVVQCKYLISADHSFSFPPSIFFSAVLFHWELEHPVNIYSTCTINSVQYVHVQSTVYCIYMYNQQCTVYTCTINSVLYIHVQSTVYSIYMYMYVIIHMYNCLLVHAALGNYTSISFGKGV